MRQQYAEIKITRNLFSLIVEYLTNHNKAYTNYWREKSIKTDMGKPIDEAMTFYDDFLIDTLNIYLSAAPSIRPREMPVL